jgi:hypothetical protein
VLAHTRFAGKLRRGAALPLLCAALCHGRRGCEPRGRQGACVWHWFAQCGTRANCPQTPKSRKPRPAPASSSVMSAWLSKKPLSITPEKALEGDSSPRTVQKDDAVDVDAAAPLSSSKVPTELSTPSHTSEHPEQSSEHPEQSSEHPEQSSEHPAVTSPNVKRAREEESDGASSRPRRSKRVKPAASLCFQQPEAAVVSQFAVRLGEVLAELFDRCVARAREDASLAAIAETAAAEAAVSEAPERRRKRCQLMRDAAESLVAAARTSPAIGPFAMDVASLALFWQFLCDTASLDGPVEEPAAVLLEAGADLEASLNPVVQRRSWPGLQALVARLAHGMDVDAGDAATALHALLNARPAKPHAERVTLAAVRHALDAVAKTDTLDPVGAAQRATLDLLADASLVPRLPHGRVRWKASSKAAMMAPQTLLSAARDAESLMGTLAADLDEAAASDAPYPDLLAQVMSHSAACNSAFLSARYATDGRMSKALRDAASSLAKGVTLELAALESLVMLRETPSASLEKQSASRATLALAERGKIGDALASLTAATATTSTEERDARDKVEQAESKRLAKDAERLSKLRATLEAKRQKQEQRKTEEEQRTKDETAKHKALKKQAGMMLTFFAGGGSAATTNTTAPSAPSAMTSAVASSAMTITPSSTFPSALSSSQQQQLPATSLAARSKESNAALLSLDAAERDVASLRQELFRAAHASRDAQVEKFLRLRRERRERLQAEGGMAVQLLSRPKLLAFCENERPPLWGTFSLSTSAGADDEGYARRSVLCRSRGEGAVRVLEEQQRVKMTVQQPGSLVAGTLVYPSDACWGQPAVMSTLVRRKDSPSGVAAVSANRVDDEDDDDDDDDDDENPLTASCERLDGRRPFASDWSMFDYGFDSEDEWGETTAAATGNEEDDESDDESDDDVAQPEAQYDYGDGWMCADDEIEYDKEEARPADEEERCVEQRVVKPPAEEGSGLVYGRAAPVVVGLCRGALPAAVSRTNARRAVSALTALDAAGPIVVGSGVYHHSGAGPERPLVAPADSLVAGSLLGGGKRTSSSSSDAVDPSHLAPPSVSDDVIRAALARCIDGTTAAIDTVAKAVKAELASPQPDDRHRLALPETVTLEAFGAKIASLSKRAVTTILQEVAERGYADVSVAGPSDPSGETLASLPRPADIRVRWTVVSQALRDAASLGPCPPHFGTDKAAANAARKAAKPPRRRPAVSPPTEAMRPDQHPLMPRVLAALGSLTAAGNAASLTEEAVQSLEAAARQLGVALSEETPRLSSLPLDAAWRSAAVLVAHGSVAHPFLLPRAVSAATSFLASLHLLAGESDAAVPERHVVADMLQECTDRTMSEDVSLSKAWVATLGSVARTAAHVTAKDPGMLEGRASLVEALAAIACSETADPTAAKRIAALLKTAATALPPTLAPAFEAKADAMGQTAGKFHRAVAQALRA